MTAAASGWRAVPVFSAGFRTFFLLAGLQALLAMLVWIAWLWIHAVGGAVIAPSFAMAPQHWHGHETIFGYASAVVAGFFLTAVPNWTGAPPAGPVFLAPLAAVWLVGRVAVWTSAGLPLWIVALLDLAFLPLLWARLLRDLLRQSHRRNLPLLGLLALLFAANLLVHLEWLDLFAGGAELGLKLGLLVLSTMITIIGGRIVPAFTRNALAAAGAAPKSHAWLDRLGILSAILLIPALALPDPLAAPIAVVAALANGARLLGWAGQHTLRQPILWSLHLGFLMLVLGFGAYAGSLAGLIGEVGALHVLGIGAVGGMTLAVMTRAALGHSGRPLRVGRAIALAYALVAVAALLRGFGVDIAPGAYTAIMLVSSALWCGGFLLFLLAFWPIFLARRI